MILSVKTVETGRHYGRPYGKQLTRQIAVLKCECGCEIIFEKPLNKVAASRFLNRAHWYAFKTGKSYEELYGCATATLAKQKLSELSLGKPSHRYGKTDVEIMGEVKAARKAASLSKTAHDNLAKGIIGPQSSKKQWHYNPFTSKMEYFHSSWEVAFLRSMIVKGVPVTKEHGIRIPYKDSNGRMRTYVPDFVQLDARVIYEIKGYMMPKDFLKVEALREWSVRNGYEAVLVTEKPV